MAKELIINSSLPEVRIALLEDGQIQEILTERPEDKGIVGNIYKGRVTRVLPGMQAAFVDIGLEKAAFLYVDDVFIHKPGQETEPVAAAPKMHFDSDSDEDTQSETSEEEAFEAGIDAQELTSPLEEEDESIEPTDIEELLEAASSEGSEAADESSDEADAEEPVADESAADENIAVEARAADESVTGEERETDADIARADEASAEEPTTEETGAEAAEPAEAQDPASPSGEEGQERTGRGRRGRRGRGRRGGRGRSGGNAQTQNLTRAFQAPRASGEPSDGQELPENLASLEHDRGLLDSDRSALTQGEEGGKTIDQALVARAPNPGSRRPEFREQRGRDRRVRSKPVKHRDHPSISDLLKEGQEVLVQVAKDPISSKGARLTCHVSLPGRHLVCMPTVDHVGVSRRIERDDDRRRLRDFVEKSRPRKMGFIVRTASHSRDAERWIRQDIEYLDTLWSEIKTKMDATSAPALVYEDLNPVLRAIRDWVNEDVDKILVDSRYHYNEIMEFANRFMPSLKEKVEQYHGDIPVFDAYGISTELSRALERKVWLKSGGYIVIDQAEALVAIDVNTGRFVGKKNLEDTILKTNLEAVEEIAYQLRMRNLGGIIILDFIDMERDENRNRVYRALEEAIKKDRARPTIMKISDIGLVEMTRKRTRDTMVRALCEPCAHCEGRGFVKSKRTVAYEVMRELERAGIERESKKLLVQAHPDVIDILAIDERDTLDTLEKRYRKQIYLQAVLDYHREQYDVSSDKVSDKQTGKINYRPQADARRGGRDRDRERGNDRNHDRGERGGRGRDRDRSRDRNKNQEGEERRSLTFKKANEVQAQQPRENTEPGNEAPLPENAQRPVSNGASTDEDRQPAYLMNQDPVSVGRPAPRTPSASQAGGGHEDEEDDRLAFLRAQAAQDAAIAGVPAQQQGRGGHRGNQNNRGGQNNQNRQGRGGRDRHGRGNRGGRGRHGSQGGGFNQNRGGSSAGSSYQESRASVEAAPSTPSDSGGPSDSNS